MNLNQHMPVKGVVPLAQMAGEDDKETKLLRGMASDAEDYLRRLEWCKELREAYFGNGCGGIVAVFLFRIEPARADVDEWLWFISGDLPPAYLVTDSCKAPSEALLTVAASSTKSFAVPNPVVPKMHGSGAIIGEGRDHEGNRLTG